eukprot:GDKI01046714.1.p1 GENE.GDKI01046714.1~~GDKI01046714.1.p1  ORF type:complete len:119 (-),score=9.21 GDKI01046714.1:25-381(-)
MILKRFIFFLLLTSSTLLAQTVPSVRKCLDTIPGGDTNQPKPIAVGDVETPILLATYGDLYWTSISEVNAQIIRILLRESLGIAAEYSAFSSVYEADLLGLMTAREHMHARTRGQVAS